MIKTAKVDSYLVIPHCKALAYKVSISEMYAVLDLKEVMPYIQPNELIKVLGVYMHASKLGCIVANVLAQTFVNKLDKKYVRNYMRCAADMIDIQDFRHIMFNYADEKMVEFLYALQYNKMHAMNFQKAIDIYFLAYPNCGISKEDFEQAFFDNFKFIISDADTDYIDYQVFIRDVSNLYTV
jgi:hypothetical protein